MNLNPYSLFLKGTGTGIGKFAFESLQPMVENFAISRSPFPGASLQVSFYGFGENFLYILFNPLLAIF